MATQNESLALDDSPVVTSVTSHLNLRARGVGVWQFAAHDAPMRFKCPYPKI